MILVITGPMFSGKSETLITMLKTYITNQDKGFVAFKHKMDTRDVGCIKSRSGKSIECIMVQDSNHITDIVKQINPKPHYVVIDEVHFFDVGLADVVSSLSNNDINVICSGLKTGEGIKPFNTTAQLLAIADEILLLKRECASCGKQTVFTKRTVDSKDEFLVGDMDIYENRCRKCYNKA